jgi:hypothetical protein
MGGPVTIGKNPELALVLLIPATSVAVESGGFFGEKVLASVKEKDYSGVIC